MKEAIGGTWLYVVVLAFIALFTCFVSVSTNYSRCFKIKDEILTTIEIYHGLNEEAVTRINDYLQGVGYSSDGECPNDGSCWYGFSTSKDNGVSGYGGRNNYCIAKHVVVGTKTASNGDTIVNGPIGHPESAYYSVAVFFQMNWPIIRQIFNIPIYGETSIIYLPRAEFDSVEQGKCSG